MGYQWDKTILMRLPIATSMRKCAVYGTDYGGEFQHVLLRR